MSELMGRHLPAPEMRRAASAKGDPDSQNVYGFKAPTDLLTKWKLLQGIVADPSVDACGKLVAVRLLDHCNTKTGRCDPSYQTIADAIGYSRRHVIRAVACLAAAGWIRIKHKRAAGRLSSNEFAFAWKRVGDQKRVGSAAVPGFSDAGNDDMAVTNTDGNSTELVTGLSLPSDAHVTANDDDDVIRMATSVSLKTENTNREEFGKKNFPVAGKAAPTPAGIVFGECRRYLERTAGISEKHARSIVGRWRKSSSDAEIIDAFSRAQRHEAQDPVAFIAGCLSQMRSRSQIGAMSAIAAIEGVEL